MKTTVTHQFLIQNSFSVELRPHCSLFIEIILILESDNAMILIWEHYRTINDVQKVDFKLLGQF